MVRKSVRVMFAALFVLVNLALVARPAGAGWKMVICVAESGEEELCCSRCFFCGVCDFEDSGDPDDDEEN